MNSPDRNMGYNDTPEDKPVPLKKCKHKHTYRWNASKYYCEDCKTWVRTGW
jgi:hypothetical protein